MLSGLKKLFGKQPRAPEMPPQELAVAQLLLEIARADFAADSVEIAAIRDLLGRSYGLSGDRLDTLLRQAEAHAAGSVSLHDTVVAINRQVSAERKLELLSMLWQVAYADGRLDKYEEALLRKLADLLFVSHADFIREKLAVIGEQGV